MIQQKTTRLSSPERLNEYIRVSRPGVWIVLGAVVAITAAAAFWACTYVISPDGLRPVDFLLR